MGFAHRVYAWPSAADRHIAIVSSKGPRDPPEDSYMVHLARPSTVSPKRVVQQ